MVFSSPFEPLLIHVKNPILKRCGADLMFVKFSEIFSTLHKKVKTFTYSNQLGIWEPGILLKIFCERMYTKNLGYSWLKCTNNDNMSAIEKGQASTSVNKYELGIYVLHFLLWYRKLTHLLNSYSFSFLCFLTGFKFLPEDR